MTQEQIQQLFKQGYNRANWKQFLAETFINARLTATPEILAGIDNHVAKQAARLGYINLVDNGFERQIAVYEVKLAKGIILERNRVGLRNLLRKYWKDIDAAFIVYENEDNHKWRFTYVSELTGYDAEGEFIKIKTEPKRYTYVLGEGESTRTAAERFAIIAKKGINVTLDDVKEAFSVEKLSKAFFDEYKKHYDIFCEFMVSKPGIRQDIFNGEEKAIRDFNKKLLGRIVFLYFIQKKGWLGVPVASKWGQGNFNFLTYHFNNFQNQDLFFQDFLCPLFFETLNKDRKLKNDIVEFIHEPCRIPYLNGGLFEEDDKKHRNLIFPHNLFKNLIDFFNQYSFTIYEDDPNEHTVAVDPEMLSHIFENLLEDNKDKGAIYTPKEIVHYMCQESLIEYLYTNFVLTETYENLRPEIEFFIKRNMLTGQLANMQNVHKLNNLLDKLKSCDPAIGSGAFPMGLLHEIFSAKQVLYLFEHKNIEGFKPSEVKLNIIQNSIYGVDIEKGAVDIARLRFWLTLIVDEPEPKPLPNLDYKIVVGNSLVSKVGDTVIDIDWEIKDTSHGLFADEFAKEKARLLKKISEEQKEFFNPSSDKKKLASEIRNLKIDLLINQLEIMVKNKGTEAKPMGTGKVLAKQTELYLQTLGWKDSIAKLKTLKANPEKPLHFFDWKLDFPEIMNENVADNVGFDIVIGNPPYVEAKKLKHISLFLKNYKVYSGTSDLSSYFFELGNNLCKYSGILCLINTNKFFNTGYGKPVRSLIIENEIKQLLNFEQVEVFEGILVSSVIVSIKKKAPEKKNVFPYKKFFKLKNIEFVKTFTEEIKNRDSYLQENLTDKEWSFADSLNLVLKNKIELNSTLLKNLKEVNVFRGVTTGYNPGFIISKDKKDELHKIDNNNIEIIKPLLQGRNIRKWIYNFNDEYLIFTKQGIEIDKYPSIKMHLKLFYNDLKPRNNNEDNGRKPGNYKWYEIQDNTAYYPEFEKPKIIWGLTADKWAYAYDENGHFLPSNGYILTSDNLLFKIKYLIALLNSNLLKYYFRFIGVMTAGGAFTLKHSTILELPIKTSPNPIRFENIVDEILNCKYQGKDIIALEKQIDNLVYRLYDLRYEEVKVIDPEFSLSKAEYEAIELEA